MDETEIVMSKKKTPATASEKYRTELEEIEQAAKDANCDTNFLYRSTLDRYVTQLNLLDQAQNDMNERGLTVVKTTPRGAEIEVANPSIQVYNQTASAANSTVSTLLRVVQTFKFKAVKPDEDNDL
nr:MAG TPA: terminase small subunit [Caudoviricetes sp.]